MALYVDVRVNDRVVATAAVQNVVGNDVCDYKGRASTAAFGSRDMRTHRVNIQGHDRRVSVWRLVAKIATQLAEKEES